MMGSFKRWLRGEVKPITVDHVAPAPGDPVKERAIRAARGDLAGALITLERRSVEIRQELSGSVLNIVAGGRQ